MVLVLAVTACAPSYLGTGDSIAERPDDIYIQVDNQSWDDIRVYLVMDTGNRRLVGDVGALSQMTRRIRYSGLFETGLTLVAIKKLTREEVNTPLLVVSPGETLVWEIMNSFLLSGPTVYIRR